jgi:hypothetical protein
MTSGQLGGRHIAAIRRHWRGLVDSGGQPTAELLGELAAIAEYHAGERTAEALKALREPQTPPVQPGSEPAVPAAAKPAPRRAGRSEPSGTPRGRRTTTGR